MDIELTANSFNAQELLRQAQLIASAFSKGLEDNNCMLMVPLSFHQNINTSYHALNDLAAAITAANNITNPDPTVLLQDSLLVPLSAPVSTSVAAAIKAAKASCFNCNLSMPKLSFQHSLSATMSELKTQLGLYAKLFNIQLPNMCQGAYALQSACLPDIVKLIAFLLTAYIAIMNLTKIGNLSVSAFIQGVLSAILGTLLGSLNVSLNLSTSSIGCLIDAIKQIAAAIPTKANILAQVSDSDLRSVGIKPERPDPAFNNYLNKIGKDIDKTLNGNITFNANSQAIVNTIPNIESDTMRNVFLLIENTVSKATDDINGFIADLLSFKTYFECEAKRNGTDVTNIIEYIGNINLVLNMLSAIAMMLAKKQIQDACKSDATMAKNDDTVGIGNDAIKDYLQEYFQQAAVIADTPSGDIQVMIYKEPLKNSLPKLSMFDCSIDDFIQAHTLENILTQAQAQVNAQQSYTSPWESYTFSPPTNSDLNDIKSVLDLLYENPLGPTSDDQSLSPRKDPIADSVLAATPDTPSSLACKSIEDVMKTLNNLKGF